MSTPIAVSAQVLTDVERVLVVMAHPDDADFGAAGTIATWVDAGIDVAYCICTSGDAGGFDDTPRAEMAPLREAEQRAAAAVLASRTSASSAIPTAASPRASSCGATSAGRSAGSGRTGC